MAFTVRDIMMLPSLSRFNLVAGKGGLGNYIITAGIVDYEFVEGIDYDLSKAFEKDSIVISSLLFAKDRPEMILPAIKFLKKSGVGAFAYKQILFEALPKEVIEYADKNDFPIFSFKEGAWFENIIFEVMAAVEKDDARYLSEAHIEKMIKGEATQEEVDNIRRGVSLLIDRAVSAGYIKMPELDANRVLRSFYISKNLKEKVLVSKYEEGVFILITTSNWKEESHRIILEEVCQSLSLPVKAKNIILSRMHSATELDKAFREGYFAWIAGLIDLRKVSNFEDLGVYSAALLLANTPELKGFSKGYMAKLKGYEETVSSYIRNGGDVVATSVDMGCHSNTIRYRLNKMKEQVNAPNETDHELFRDLSIAYMVAKVLAR